MNTCRSVALLDVAKGCLVVWVPLGFRVVSVHSALYVPAHTPPDIVAKIERETAAALRAPAVQAQFGQLGVEPMPMNREQFAKFFRDDVAANLELVKIAKIPTQ